MKIYYLLPIMIFLFAQCKTDRGPIKFEMDYVEETFTINPGFDPLLTHVFEFKNMPTLIEKYKSTHGVSDEEIVSILPARCRFINVSGNEDYDYINEVSVKIIPFDQPGKRFEIFYHQPTFNNLGLTLNLIPNDNNLKEILLQDRFSVEVHLIRFKERPSTSITSRIEMEFDVR